MKGLKNNYLSPVIAAALLLTSLCASAQIPTSAPHYDSTRNLQPINADGFNWTGTGKFGGGLIIPKDTFKLAYKDSGAIAYKGGLLQIWNGLFWSGVIGSGSIIINDSTTGLAYLTFTGTNICQHFSDSTIICNDLNTLLADIRYNADSTLMCLYNGNNELLRCLSTLKEVVVFHGNVAVNKINDTTHVYINGLTNGLISADVSLVDSTVTVSNIYFRRNDTIYTLLGSNSFIINSALPGHYRTDIIWVDSTNTIRHTVGTEDTIATIAPSIDYNGIRITTVDVFGSVITTPSVSVTSDGWLVKGNNILPAGDSTWGSLTPKGVDMITNGVKRIGITRDGKIIYPSLQSATDTTANKPAVMDVSTGQLKKLSYWPGGGTTTTTSYQTQTASGSTTFTFTSVPASYNDYIVFVNGAKIRSTTDYTTSGNVVTIPTIVSGDVVEFQRIK